MEAMDMKKLLLLLIFGAITTVNFSQTVKSIYRSDGPVIRIPLHLIDTVDIENESPQRKLIIKQKNDFITKIPVSLIDSIKYSQGVALAPSELGEIIFGSVMGVITDHTGKPLADAIVKSGFDNKQIRTDTNGVFILDSIKVYEKLGLIKIQKPGFFEGSRSFIPIPTNRNLIRVQMSRRLLVGSFQAITGGTVTSEGLTVYFPPNIINKNGQSFTGQVQVYSAVYNPTEPNFNDRMPGDLIGCKGDSLQMLRSFGMADIEITDASGAILQIKPEKLATLSFTIPDVMLSEADEKIGFWSFDSKLGYWIYEGDAILVGNTYVGKAGHFSPWNADKGFIPIELNFECRDVNNVPISGGKIETPNWAFGNPIVYSNALGKGVLRVRPNQVNIIDLKLYCSLSSQWVSINTLAVQPLSESTDIPISNQLSGSYCVSGIVNDCNGNPADIGYVVSSEGSIAFLNNGEYHLWLCSEGNIELRAFQNKSDSVFASNPVKVTVESNRMKLDPISVCENIQTYVNDIDGNRYPIVLIGTQIWIGENLRTTRFNDGTQIPFASEQGQWVNGMMQPMMCWYNNDPIGNFENKYGALYNGYVINQFPTPISGNKNICPAGWHVPSDTDWTILETYLGGSNLAGGKLKSTGTGYWLSPNFGATNESAFSALPGGHRADNGGFLLEGQDGYWWCSKLVGNNDGLVRFLNYNDSNLSNFYFDLNYGMSVRCIKD
jgi:uncharacterized protein (TIGR02145 family)